LKYALFIFTHERNPRDIEEKKVSCVATMMAGKDPCESKSTGICDIFCHYSMKLIGQPEPHERGNDFYQFCDRFTDFVRLHGFDKNLDLILKFSNSFISSIFCSV
jgi:hypothetical protein